MTKDRRLGRGLAALLGTPLDESQLAEGADSNPPDSMPSPAVASDAASSTASQSRSNTQRTPQPGSSLASGSRPATSSKPRTHNASTGVTGAVPLGSVLSSGSTSLGRELVNTNAVSRDADASSGGATREIDVNLIDANPFQPRRQFHPEEIAALAESLKEHQQLQPVLVRQIGSRYQLISGERRLRAAIHAGLAQVRAEVREADDRLVAELAIVENLQRKDLNPIEKALSFRRYLDQHACTQEELAKRLKIDRSTIANLMRLLELPEAILEAVQADRLSAGHARALLPLGDESQQLSLAARIQAEGWNVRQTEHHVTEMLAREESSGGAPAGGKSRRSSARTVTPQIGALEQELRRALGTKIEIKQAARGRGKIVVHFHSAEEFERIRELMVPAGQRAAA